MCEQWIAHCEELLQSLSNFIFSQGCQGCQKIRNLSRKYSLPGWSSTHHWVNPKTIIEKHQKLRKIIINILLVNFLMPKIFLSLKIEIWRKFFNDFDAFFNGFWFYPILAEWSTWQWVFLNFSQNFWSLDTPKPQNPKTP